MVPVLSLAFDRSPFYWLLCLSRWISLEDQLGGGPIESSHSGRRAAPGELGRELRTHSSLRSRIAAEGRWEQEEL
jgi:hypothetical protein